MSSSEGLKEPLPGWLANDGLTKEWLEHVREYRERCNSEDCKRILDSEDGRTETATWDK